MTPFKEETSQSNATPLRLEEPFSVDESHQKNMEELHLEMQEMQEEFEHIGLKSDLRLHSARESAKQSNINGANQPLADSEPRAVE